MNVDRSRGRIMTCLGISTFCAFLKAPRLIRKRSDEKRLIFGCQKGQFCPFWKFTSFFLQTGGSETDTKAQRRGSTIFPSLRGQIISFFGISGSETHGKSMKTN